MNLRDLQAEGRKAASEVHRDPRAALDRVLPLLAYTGVLDYDGYDDWLMTAGDAFARVGQHDARGFTRYARGDVRGALDDQHVHSIARALLHEAAREPDAAAAIYQRNGCWALAAYAYEAADRDATEAWESAIVACPADVDPIGNGLAWLGLAQWQLPRDPAAARAALPPGLMGLARCAVVAEERDDLEAAARHYQLMAAVGAELGATEHLLEGALNAARVHQAMNDGSAALRTHLQTAARCVELDEPHAAALCFQDAARLADIHARHQAPIYWQAAAECWEAAAAIVAPLTAGFAENALLARIDALNHIGAAGRVRTTFMQLESLPLPAERTAHYATLRARLGPGEDAPPPPPVGTPRPPPTPRFADLLAARELGTDLEAVLLAQSVRAPSAALRRDAIAALLRCRWANGQADAAQVLAQCDGEAVWTALEHLLETGDLPTRQAGLSALAERPERRATALLLNGLRDLETHQSALNALTAIPRRRALGLLHAAARQKSAAAGPAIDALAALGDQALDALWQLSQGDDHLALDAKAHFERICPPEQRAAWR